jgi:uncharacterized protein involved in outer membrane biogenesis
MKKLIIRVVLVLVVLLVLAIVAAGVFLDAGIKRAIVTIGPKLTQTDIKLQSVSLSLLSGSGSIKGLVVGNPSGFKTPEAINIGQASLSLKPSSLLSDKVVIKSINLQEPQITFETDLRANNLSKIMSNVQAATGGNAQPSAQPAPAPKEQPAKASRKLQVDDFIITGGKVHVSVTALGGQAVTVALPDIHLQNLGTGPEGITAAELTKTALAAIEAEAAKAAAGGVSGISKTASSALKEAGSQGTNVLKNVTKGIGNLFKKP